MELIVVVAVVTVLVGLLLPAAGRARRQAQRIHCLAALRQLAAANHLYLNDNRDWWLPLKWGVNPNPAPGWPAPPPLPQPPSLPFQGWSANAGFRAALRLSDRHARYPAGLICPRAVLAFRDADRNGLPIGRSYGYNSTGLNGYAHPPTYYAGHKRAQVRRAHETLMFADATSGAISIGGSSRYFTHGEAWGPPPLNGITAYRHERGLNAAFWDGHAEYLRADQVVQNEKLWRTTK